MKVHPKDNLNKNSIRTNKRDSQKKNNISNKSNQTISSPKNESIKNIKKNINYRLSSSKSINNNLKETFESKYSLKHNFKNKPNSNNRIISTKYKSEKNNKQKVKNKNNNNSNDKVNNKANKSFNNVSKIIEKSKIINNFSNSTGLSNGSKENKKYINFGDSEHKNIGNNYNNDSHSEKANIFIEENNQNINNFSYESCSKEDSYDNKIIFRCDDYSLFTFGKSNSKKNKSTDKINYNYNDINIDKNYNKNICSSLLDQSKKNNIYVNKLKKENEILKKELKESNEQINFLMYKIKELKGLKDNKNIKSKKFEKKKICQPNIWDKRGIKFEVSDKENYNICNNYQHFKLSFENKINEKSKNKKDLLKEVNENNNISKNNKKILNNNIKTNINNKKIKIKNKSHSLCSEHIADKINECISMIKI